MSGKRIVFVVDDRVTIGRIVKDSLGDQYDVHTIASGIDLLNTLKSNTPNLILLDVEMPGMGGFEVKRRLNLIKALSDIPVMFLIVKQNSNSTIELEGLKLGAIDYIYKPITPALLKARVDAFFQLKNLTENLEDAVGQKTWRIQNLKNTILNVVGEVIESRDVVTGAHILRTQDILRVMLDHMHQDGICGYDISGWDIDLIARSALIHDIGKVAIPDKILTAPRKLKPEETEIMRTHARKGAEIIDRMAKHAYDENDAYLRHARIFAIAHHERWDGKGYPRGIQGTDIPLEGRLMAIVDSYETMISERPYVLQKKTHEEAYSEIIMNSGTQFDPNLVEIFKLAADKIKAITET